MSLLRAALILLAFTPSLFAVVHAPQGQEVLGRGVFLFSSVSEDHRYQFKIFTHAAEIWDPSGKYLVKTLNCAEKIKDAAYLKDRLLLDLESGRILWNLLGDAVVPDPLEKGKKLKRTLDENPEQKTEPWYLLAVTENYLESGEDGSIVLREKNPQAWVVFSNKNPQTQDLSDDGLSLSSDKSALVFKKKEMKIDFLVPVGRKITGISREGISLDQGMLVFSPSVPEAVEMFFRESWKNSRDAKTLELLRKLFPEDPQLIYQQARLKMESKEYAEAETLLRATLKMNARNTEYQEALGMTLLYLKNYSEALKILKTLHSPESLFYTGNLYYLTGKRKEARNTYLQALQKNPNEGRIYGNLFVIYREEKNLKKAEDILLKGIEKNPLSATLYSHLGVLMQDLKKTALALLAYEKAFSLDAQNLETAEQLYYVYLKLSMPQEALTLLKKVLAIYPEEPTSHYNIALLYREFKNYPLAVFHFRAFLSFSKDEALKKKVQANIEEILKELR